MVLKLSWTLAGKGGNKKISSWDDIERCLYLLKDMEGTLTLDIINSDENEAEMLQLRTEKGFYFMTLSGVRDDEYVVRTYNDLSQPNIEIMILGDDWPAQQVTRDFNLVVRIFKEFFDTGNVSKDLLSC